MLFDCLWSRRKWLKGALVCGSLLLKGRLSFAASGEQGTLPEGKLSFYNIHNNERLSVTYRDLLGAYDPGALQAMNHILRCRHTGKTVEMDLQVIEYLNLIDKNLGGGNLIHVISGYRSPEFNDLLSSEGHGVAKNSLHTVGKAIDISIPGVTTQTLREYAYSLAYGGVGYYPKAGFVHIDSGGFRTWSGA